MLKKHMAACLVASAFITMPVLAQTSTSPGATSPGAGQPATTAPSPGASGAGAASGAASGRFITQQQPNQWRASRLIGLDVYGANNEKIGDVNEVLVDRQGNADAVVVGVGGFLGIGEKNVALPFNAFEWQMEERRTATASGTGAGAGGTAATDRPATTGSAPAGTAGTGGTAPSATGTTGSGGGAARSAERGYPDHAILRMSKADLENAPTFRYVGERASDERPAAGTGGTGGGATSPSAPRQ
jgi:hypothetical protein